MKDRLENLTITEKEVLELVAQNYSNTEIARKMYMSCSTVKSKIRSILFKLNATGRVQASVVALQHGMIELNK